MNIDNRSDSFGTSAYGGSGFSHRVAPHVDDLGSVWRACGIDSEWRRLRAVLMHPPGVELVAAGGDVDAVQMLAVPDQTKAGHEHDKMQSAFEDAGVDVHLVDPECTPPPNQMFCADLVALTPQGAILARPASTVRAGEERHVARRLAALGIPILRTMTGTAVFEGADLMWLDASTAVIGRGGRTNQVAIDQIASTLEEIGTELLAYDMPFGSMHLMGLLRIVDQDLAIAWPRRTPHGLVQQLRQSGYEVVFPPLADDADHYRAMNFVTLGPREILMVEGLDPEQRFFEDVGIECRTSPTDELSKAAGNIGCLTSVLRRDMAGA